MKQLNKKHTACMREQQIRHAEHCDPRQTQYSCL